MRLEESLEHFGHINHLQVWSNFARLWPYYAFFPLLLYAPSTLPLAACRPEKDERRVAPAYRVLSASQLVLSPFCWQAGELPRRSERAAAEGAARSAARRVGAATAVGVHQLVHD